MSVVSVCDLVLLPLVQKSRASHVLPVEAFAGHLPGMVGFEAVEVDNHLLLLRALW